MSLSLLGVPWDTLETAWSHPLRTKKPICRCDIEEDDKNIFVDAEVPGVPQKNIKVELENNILRIRGEVQRERKQTGVEPQFRLSERAFGEFSRSFTLPGKEQIDINNIKATYSNGCLQIRIPKVKPSASELKRIQIS
jgi:HSP20 family protein